MNQGEALQRVREAVEILKKVENRLCSDEPDGAIAMFSSVELLDARIEVENAIAALANEGRLMIRAALFAELDELATAAASGRLDHESAWILDALIERLGKLAHVVQIAVAARAQPER